MQMKYMDGTPVDADYAKTIAKLVHNAAEATEHISEDDLEAYAAEAATKTEPQPIAPALN